MSKKLSATRQATVPQNKSALLTLLWLTPVLVAVSAGCRSTIDNQVDLLERELRTQQDYIYELESYVVEYSEKLRDTRSAYPQQTAVYAEEMQESEPAPRRAKKKMGWQTDREASILKPEDNLSLPAPPQRELEISPEKISPEKMEVPDEIEFEIDDPVSELEDARPLRQVAAVQSDDELFDDGMLIIPDPVDFESNLTDSAFEGEQFAEELFEDQQVEETAAIVVRVAERLEVTQLFQGEGDELSPKSLLTVVEALDDKGEPVDLDGEISLMVMTSDEATPQRMKRWNFTAEETAAAWQSSNLGDGLHLELPLEKVQLPATPLELWVRLVTADGRKLLTQLPFDSNQLTSITTDLPKQRPAGLSLARVGTPAKEEAQRSATPQDPLRIQTNSLPPRKELKLSTGEAPANQPRWRASMQRTDRTAASYAASSKKIQGWTTQALGRQPSAAAQVASRTLPGKARQVASQAPSQPVWSSGRSAPPVAPQTSQPPTGTTPAAWSSSR